MEERQVKIIQSVNRALEILEFLMDAGDGFPLATIADKFNLNKTTTYHLLKTLESRGYVDQSFDTKFYKPGWKIYDIASKTWGNQTLVKAGKPYLEVLNKMFDETVLLCYSGMMNKKIEGICFCEIESSNPLRTSCPPGTILPLYCTSQGIEYLTGLAPDKYEEATKTIEFIPYTRNTILDLVTLRERVAQAKHDGFCIEREEFQEGVCTVAVPVFKYTGRVLFSLVISMPTQRATNKRFEEMIAAMKPMAEELSRVSL